jgi:serine protease Do
MDKNKQKAKRYLYALAGLAVLAVSFTGGWLGSASRQSMTTTSSVQQRTILKNEANVISEIASEVGPSVVSVNVTSQSATSTNPYYYLFGYGSGSTTEESAGTGIILNEDGLVLTNRHVVPAGTTDVSVTLSDGTVLDDVKVIGRTSENDSLDIAFLKIGDKKGHTLTGAKIGDSSLMKVGDSVVAIGNTLGQFQNTVTSGIISGYGRSIEASDSGGSSSSASTESLDGLFQTDAAINEGNSGGPLVNLAGEVIGINTAIASDSQNVGFAIPINDVIGLIQTVEETGKLERPYLGVRYVLLTDDIAKEYDLKVSRGAYIPQQTSQSGETVVTGGPADKAGIEPGDVITKIDGTAIDEKTSLTSLLGKHKVGDTVKVTVQRGSDVKTMDVTLGAADTE